MIEDDQTAETEEEAPEQLDPVDQLAEAIDLGQSGRLWLRSARRLLKIRGENLDPNPRVQFALDKMTIALCESVERVCRAVVPEAPAEDPPGST